MKIIGIIQAHSKDWGGGKDPCLNIINNEYVIENVIHKLKQIEEIEEIVIAVPDIPENKIFENIADKENIRCFYGSTCNVLDRFIKAAEFIGGDFIVKIGRAHV
jgi:spore coat polysaccharide biosynthesis protein SpsF (cytidylyltransferase family)